MKKWILLILIGGMAAGGARGQSDRGPKVLAWAPAGILVDGDLREWGNPLRFYDAGTQIAYAVANDSSNLYIGLRVSDEMMKRKIMSVGLTIGIDTLGKKKPQAGITFPLSGSLVFDQMELNGFRSGDGVSPTRAKNGIAVAIGHNDSQDLTYEASIPWKSLLGATPATGDLQRKMTLEIRVPPMAQSARDERMKRAGSDDDDASLSGLPGGGRLGAGGRMGGGRMGAGRGGGMGPGGMPGGIDYREEQTVLMRFYPAKPSGK